MKNHVKIENWNGHAIRCVEKDGDWWWVAADVCAALDHTNTSVALEMIDDDERCLMPKRSLGIKDKGQQDISLVSETGLYTLIIRSNLPEAKTFRRWVCGVIRKLRKSLGLSEYEAFRLMDTEYQNAKMGILNAGLHEPAPIDFMKANCTTDKAVSTLHGFPKMLKKRDMTEAMLRDRQIILDDTVQLMILNEKLGLGLSVSKAIYGKYCAAA
jgi:prophage antirepressor-like protein